MTIFAIAIGSVIEIINMDPHTRIKRVLLNPITRAHLTGLQIFGFAGELPVAVVEGPNASTQRLSKKRQAGVLAAAGYV